LVRTHARSCASAILRKIQAARGGFVQRDNAWGEGQFRAENMPGMNWVFVPAGGRLQTIP
jgi:hypothetical protein